MSVKGVLGGVGIAVGVAAVAELGVSGYFFRRTMTRNNAKNERTEEMSGTDWDQHRPLIAQRREVMVQQPHEDVWTEAEDGLKLHATWYPQGDKQKVVICFHGYTSEGTKDYIALSDYYFANGYSMLLIDERAHGQSEGKYIGFGCLDRKDGIKWIDWILEECGEKVQILLHGTSMGGATVLMMSGLPLPEQVKGIVSDCAFTSPKQVFTHVLKNMMHMPAFPIMQISEVVNRNLAGYGLDECNAAREVKKATVPILMIHGSADTFVPAYMCDEIYENIASPKKKLIVEGAAHAESYYKDIEGYEKALTEFIDTL